MNDGVAVAEPGTRDQPGLAVSLTAWPDDYARCAVQANVEEGTLPLALSLYLDGDLVDTEMGAPPVHAFLTTLVSPGRHVLTVRVVDGAGRWGGASTLIESRPRPRPARR